MRARSVARRITQPLRCTYFDGACRYCGVHGHRERDCRKKQAASKNSGETAAVVTTPGPTTGQVAFVESRQLEGRIGLDPRCHEGSCEGAMHQDGGRGRVHRGQWLRGDDSQHRTGRQTWGGQSKEFQRHCITLVVVISTVLRVAACTGNFETRSGGPFPVALECHVGDVQRKCAQCFASCGSGFAMWKFWTRWLPGFDTRDGVVEFASSRRALHAAR